MGCKGKLLPISNASEARKAPGIPPDVPNVSNWLSRKILQTHNQSVISSKWVFQYQLSGTPALHVYIYKDDGSLEETTAFTYTLSQQKLTVTLGIPSRGIVQCVTPSPATTYSQVGSTNADTHIQISSDNGDITIATLDSADTLGVSLVYLPQGNSTTLEYFGIDTNPATTSPWINVHAAVVNGRKYYVRSFNVHTAASAVEYFSTGVIPSGTSLYFSAVGSKPMTPGSSVLLLGNPPYNFVDRVYDKVVDISSVSQSSVTPLFYADGKVYATFDITRHTYPSILIL